jgi:hydrogenase/urease accessory protein HupE
VQGIGSFWSGVAHLLTSLDQLAFLLGLAIWTSFLDSRFDPLVIGAAFGAALIGTLAGLIAGGGLDLTTPMAALVIGAGLAGVMRLRLGSAPLLGMASAGALVIGAAGADATAGLSYGLFSLGTAVAAASALSYGLLAARSLETEWGRIARRAGASWIAAIGLMVLALSLARQTGRV